MESFVLPIVITAASAAYLCLHYAWRCREGRYANEVKWLIIGIAICFCGLGFNIALAILSWLGEI